ncbi:uncharacterized protein cubi_01716 [Cryptosporidium ubiquitum]|uniref:Uncharacterized protein n=1 Tax=Cryptosporidium ubiquitum TaxID=857276 RepID=A0A1J4MAJ1_9CRYT|nr:uncharacterized protein cubi_01716 [Cryptosporidium ubiquitum]OII71241.1 hypothetical protein cubi_01716 [Cryptosporidium ubiquitum]
MRNNIDLIFEEANNEKLKEGITKNNRLSTDNGNKKELDLSNSLDYLSSSINYRQSVCSVNSNLPENSNKGLFDDLEDELYKDSIDSKLDSLKINNNDLRFINDTVEDRDLDGVGIDINNINNDHYNITESNHKDQKSNIVEILNKVEDRRTSMLSNDQNSFTDDSMFNVNNSFGSNMANYSAYDSVHEINLGSNQKIENHENVLLNRMIDNQGIYNDINTMCETLSATIKDNFQIHNNEIKNLTDKVNNIENKLNELITLFTTKMKSVSQGNNASFNSNNYTNNGNNLSDHAFNRNNNQNNVDPFPQFNDRFGGGGMGGLGGSDYNINLNNRNIGQNIGNIRQNQLFTNNNHNILSQNSAYSQRPNIDGDDIFGNSNFNNGSKMNSNSFRESQKEAEKRAEIERIKKLEAERRKKEEAERKRIEEEKRKQKEEAERKLKADIKRKEIMDSLFACQASDNASNSEKKPSLFGDESSDFNSRKNLFDD